jgi:hypothetical protein
VYVDEHGDDTSTTDTHGGDDHLTVEVDGQTYDVQENYDFDGDHQNDTAVVETQDGYIAFADTDHDGTADVAVQYDHDGNIVAGAEYNESTHQWTEENPDHLPTPSGGGADDGGAHSGGHSHDPGHQSDTSGRGQTTDTSQHTDTGGHQGGGHQTGGHTTDTSQHTDTGGHQGGGHQTGGHSSAHEDITVDTPNGQFDAGQANYDTDGDGTDDTSIVTDKDGTTYAFTDADGDGKADEAVVIGADGHVTVAENTGGDQWQVVDEGHLNSDGTYHSDSSGSDSVWAESK